jgi:hypothetical protein
MGAFPLYGSADDVLTLCKSHDHKLLVTGDSRGVLQLRNYPSPALESPCVPYHGHSAGGVGRALFTQGDKYLLSIGRDDR